jgi:hypothetical protein
MRAFSFYIFDDRYSVPTLVFVPANDEPEARDLAAHRLAETRHYRKVEVWEGDALLFSCGGARATRPLLDAACKT